MRQIIVSSYDSQTNRLSHDRRDLNDEPAEPGTDAEEPLDPEYRIEVTDSDDLQLDWSPGGRADVHFSAAFHSTQWRFVRRELDGRLSQGVRDWTIHLTGMGFCDSITLGCFISIQSAIRRRGGRVRFLVDRGSRIYRILESAKLHLVLDLKDVQDAT